MSTTEIVSFDLIVEKWLIRWSDQQDGWRVGDCLINVLAPESNSMLYKTYIQNLCNHGQMGRYKPLNPSSDQHLISPYSNTAASFIKIM